MLTGNRTSVPAVAIVVGDAPVGFVNYPLMARHDLMNSYAAPVSGSLFNEDCKL
jgi:hypothetical protein